VGTALFFIQTSTVGVAYSLKGDAIGDLARPVITVCAIALRGLIYQFREAATKLLIKNVFDTFHAFIMRQRMKLISEYLPLIDF
jgi:hypothetical protein